MILDTYSAHRSAEVREMARLWGIDLVFTPPGCTDWLQLLDRRAFGVLYARQIWRMRYHEMCGQKVTKPMVAERLSDARNRITTDILDSTWCIYLPELDEMIPNIDSLYRLTTYATSKTRIKIF
jgi:hypothetical protein